MFVLLATERLGLSSFQFGLLLTVDAVASVIMSFLVMGLVRRTSHGSSMKLSVVAYSMQAFLLGFTTLIPLVILAVLLGGVSDPTWNVISATTRQRLVDDLSIAASTPPWPNWPRAPCSLQGPALTE